MWWEIYFWLIASVLVLPLPFKLFGYVSGKDKSPAIVKIEEIGNACFLAIGLVGLYGYLHDIQLGSSLFWYLWLGIGVAWSLFSIFWSPKLKYAATLAGSKLVIAAGALGVVLCLPMLFAIYRYAAQA